jgi:hypothetical protein
MQLRGRNGIIATPGPDYNATRRWTRLRPTTRWFVARDVGRRLLSRAARDHEIADKYLHGLAVLI